MVIDADGLGLLPEVMDHLDAYAYPVIITPHVGEMSRLTGRSSAEVGADPLIYGEAFSKAHGLITVLKSSRTLVATPDGGFCINTLGNSGMATAGSGDVLAGIILSMLGQGVDSVRSAALGVGLHSMAGDMVAREKGESGLMATDMIEAMTQILKTGD